MAGIEKYIKGLGALVGKRGFTTNAPPQYDDRKARPFLARTRRFYEKRGRIASDVVTVSTQGLTSDFYAWTQIDVRLADATAGTLFETRKMDDYKEVHFLSPLIDYFPIGAKMETMGSTWLSINPTNVSAVDISGLVARCNAVYHYYDAWGNTQSEPLVIENYTMYRSTPSSPQNFVNQEGNFKITAQLNDVTQNITENTRIMLGKRAFYITGVQDFTEEFTGESTDHLITFFARLEEVNETDDTVNGVAGGLAYTFSADIDGPADVTVGQSASLTASFMRNGLPVTGADFKWTSDHPETVSISDEGIVTGIAEGNAVVRATLAQNENIWAERSVSAVEGQTGFSVILEGESAIRLKKYTTAFLKAHVLENGEEVKETVEWSFDGAPSRAWFASESGNSLSVTCQESAEAPLVVTASYGGASESVTITLEGY